MQRIVNTTGAANRFNAARLAGLDPQARLLLEAALTLDLPQRRLLVAALRPGARSEYRSGTQVHAKTHDIWLPFDQNATAARQAVFAGPIWRDAFRPGTELHVYVVGTPGLQPLAVALGLSIAKIGTCHISGLDKRLGQLRREAYGSTIRCRRRYVTEPGFDGWGPPPHLQLKAGPALGPVRRSTRSFIVALPEGITAGLFEYDLNKALSPITLASFADSDAGRHWCAARHVDPNRLIRFTRVGKGRAPQAAAELMIVRPQTDGPALAAIMETIILGYLGLSPTPMPGSDVTRSTATLSA